VAGKGLVVAYVYQGADAANVADRYVGEVDDEVVRGGQLVLDGADELVRAGHIERAGRADAQTIDSWVCI
jgi:hypothetical protein